MKLIDTAKKLNRTILEMYLGILFWGFVCQIVGAVLVTEQVRYAGSLWLGIAMAMLGVVHMYRTLDIALDFDEKNAANLITRGFLIRYAAIVILLAVVMITNILNPLVVFLGYMSMKGAAYLQPFTHRLCNKVFHETDPVPMPLPPEESEDGSDVSLTEGEDILPDKNG